MSNLAANLDQLSQFLALASNVMGSQSHHLNISLQHLFTQLANDLSSDQKAEFQDTIRRSRFLMREIITYWEVYDAILKLHSEPSQIEMSKIDVTMVLTHAIEDGERFVGLAKESVGINMTDKELGVHSIYPLLRHVISSLIIWTHLLASDRIQISIAQTDNETTLTFSGYNLSSIQLDEIDQEMVGLLTGLASLIVSVLGGSGNWKPTQTMPNEEELVVSLPRRL